MKREDFEKGLQIEDPVMDPIRIDINAGIQKLINEMISKGADDGTLTAKISFVIEEKEVGDRIAHCLHFAYKVNNTITIKDEVKNEQANSQDELEYVNGQWILMPIKGMPQKTLLDIKEES